MSEILTFDVGFVGGRNVEVSERFLKPDQSRADNNAYSRPVGALTKRPGYIRRIPAEMGSSDNTVGLHRLYTSDGSKVLLAVAGTSVYYGDASMNVLKAGMTYNKFMQFITMSGYAVGVNGADNPIRTDGVNVWDAELQPPLIEPRSNTGGAAPMTLVNVGSGNLSPGVYAYLFRASYGKLGESGWARTLSGGDWVYGCFVLDARLAAGDFNVQIDWPAGSTLLPPPAEELRIYRTLKQDDVLQTLGLWDVDPNTGVSPWMSKPYYRVGKVTSTVSFTDNIADVEVGELADAELERVPRAKYIAEHRDRAFYAGGSGYDATGSASWPPSGGIEEAFSVTYTLQSNRSNRLWWSDLYNPTVIQAGAFVDVNPEDGDSITALASLGDALLILKRRNIYVLLGTSPQDFEIRKVVGGVGCVAPRSVAVHQNVAFFMGEDNVWTCDGVNIQPIGDPVRTDVVGVPAAARELAAGVYHDGRYLLAFHDGS